VLCDSQLPITGKKGIKEVKEKEKKERKKEREINNLGMILTRPTVTILRFKSSTKVTVNYNMHMAEHEYSYYFNLQRINHCQRKIF